MGIVLALSVASFVYYVQSGYTPAFVGWLVFLILMLFMV